VDHTVTVVTIGLQYLRTDIIHNKRLSFVQSGKKFRKVSAKL